MCNPELPLMFGMRSSQSVTVLEIYTLLEREKFTKLTRPSFMGVFQPGSRQYSMSLCPCHQTVLWVPLPLVLGFSHGSLCLPPSSLIHKRLKCTQNLEKFSYRIFQALSTLHWQPGLFSLSFFPFFKLKFHF